MFETEIGGKTAKAEVTFYTALLYEQEFGGDMLKDLFGVQSSDPALVVDGGEVVTIDFTKTNWTVLMKVLWAAVKTADEFTPNYTAWMRKARGTNLFLVNQLLSEEIGECFFHTEAAEEGAEEKEEG